MDELDQQAKQFRVNAESLEGLCEKLTHLSQDKRKARKSYHEEHTKIASRLTQVSFCLLFRRIYFGREFPRYSIIILRGYWSFTSLKLLRWFPLKILLMLLYNSK